MLTSLDLDATIAFYARLGFECVGTFGEPKPTWCQVARDDVRLMFNLGDAEPHDHGDGVLHADVPAMSGSIYLDVDDVDVLFSDVGAGAAETVEWEPTTYPHGMREFALRDNNGYLLIFGTPVA
jgi:catechol 2,3-dioxygenase-like lactoylglutathione lyase family enzyme